MLELLQKIIAILTADATLTAIVPTAQILTGPVDIVAETQGSLPYPQVNMHVIAEVQRSNPLGTRDTQIQIDIWSRNSQLEIENIYEEVIKALSYQTTDQSTAHLFWSKLGGAIDDYESDRRIWHRAVTFVFWSLK